MVKVLVSGGSGFIAAHIVDVLIERGHQVVFTVRSEEKGNKVINAYLHKKLPEGTLSYVIVKDIAIEGAFDKAVVSSPPFDAVIHAASPFFFGHDDPVKEILDPAIIGTTGILKAIKTHAPSVKHVAITSSFAAIVNGKDHPKKYDESIWNPVTQEEALEPASTYRASKTFAERAAWKFVEEEKPNFTLSTLNPPLVFGPVLPQSFKNFNDLNTSNQRIYDFVTGKNKDELPPSSVFLWVDVRDLALAHVKAIEEQKAAGLRFFITAGYFSNKGLAETIRKTAPEFDSKLPPADSAEDLPGDVYEYDNSRSKEILGITYRPFEESIADTVKSFQHLGL